MIFMLYFSHIETDRFGTIRQQIWMILHYPLHVAILLTVEGSTFLMLSGVLGSITEAWGALYPLSIDDDWETFFARFSSSEEVVASISSDVTILLNITFKDPAALVHLYDYTKPIAILKNITAPYNSSEWQDLAGGAIDQLWGGVEVAIYYTFGIEGHDPHDHSPSAIEQAASAQNVMHTVFLYFYFSAGSLLFVLAIMCIFAKKDLSKEMWMSVAVKVFVGVGVTLPVLAYWVGGQASVSFFLSAWTIAVVMLGYFIGKICPSTAARERRW